MEILSELTPSASTPTLRFPASSDNDLTWVEFALIGRAGGRAELRDRIGHAIRRSYDQVYNGQSTGHFHWAQLSKTEKTHCGSVVEIWLQRELGLADGENLDFAIGGFDVDCKFSQKMNGWMLPPEVRGGIAMVVTADDYSGIWSLGLVWVTDDRLRESTNRDRKSTLNDAGRAAICWLFRDEPIPANALLQISPEDAVAIMCETDGMRRRSGQRRLNELFRRAQGRRISRNVIATVARQGDFMKRVRSNGGARTGLQEEGIVLLGHYERHRQIVAALGFSPPNAGEIVSIRLTNAEADWSGPAFELDGHWWRTATDADPVVKAPRIPHT